MSKKYWVKELRRCLRHKRKLTKQVDRKIKSLAAFGRLELTIKKELIALCEYKPYVKAKE